MPPPAEGDKAPRPQEPRDARETAAEKPEGAESPARPPEGGQEQRDPNIRAEDYWESPSRPSWWRWVFGGGS